MTQDLIILLVWLVIIAPLITLVGITSVIQDRRMKIYKTKEALLRLLANQSQ